MAGRGKGCVAVSCTQDRRAQEGVSMAAGGPSEESCAELP